MGDLYHDVDDLDDDNDGILDTAMKKVLRGEEYRR